MKPTTKRLLSVIAFVGAVCALSLSRITLSVSGTLMPVRALTPLATGVMALTLLWWTLIVRRRLPHIARARHDARMQAQGTPTVPFRMVEKPLHPIVAARTVALAFATSRAGAYVGGWYVGVAVSYVGHLASEDVQLRLLYAGLTAALALALVVIAVWLERSCQLPPSSPEAQASPA